MRFSLLFLATVCLAADPVTFTESIAPLVYRNCTTCHRPGGGAPFSLITYEDVAARARLIAEVTASRYMPPWHAAPGPSKFAGERHLTDAQIRTFADWAAQGMPQGIAAKLPPQPQFRDGWTLGEPDLVPPDGYRFRPTRQRTRRVPQLHPAHRPRRRQMGASR